MRPSNSGIRSKTQMFVKRRCILGLVVIVLGILVLGILGGLLPAPKERLRTNFATSFGALYMAKTTGSSAPVSEYLMFLGPFHIQVVNQLNDLKGCVHLASPAQALEFVRLRTSLSTWQAWGSPPFRAEQEAEVVSDKDAPTIPTFGLDRVPDLPYDPGSMGILPLKTFRLGGFTPARASSLRNGFCIVRWILCFQAEREPYTMVQKIQEFVGMDGSYRRIILEKKEPPELPNVRWGFETFE